MGESNLKLLQCDLAVTILKLRIGRPNSGVLRSAKSSLLITVIIDIMIIIIITIKSVKSLKGCGRPGFQQGRASGNQGLMDTSRNEGSGFRVFLVWGLGLRV